MRILYISLFFFLSFLNLQGQNNFYSVKLTLKGEAPKLITLRSIYGSQSKIIDTAYNKDNVFHFSKDHDIVAGIYSFDINDSLYLDFILNHEEVEIETSLDNLILDMNVVKSKENSLYFDYWKTILNTKDSITNLRIKSIKLTQNGNSSNKKQKKITQSLLEIENRRKAYTYRIIEQNKDLFVSNVIRSYQKPNYQTYLDTCSLKQPLSLKHFQNTYFFHNLDFSDERFLFTDILFISINDYIKKSLNIPSTQAYIQILNFILNKAEANPKVYKYCVELFMQNMENTIWEKVFVWLVDRKYLPYAAKNNSVADFYRKKSTNIKNIQIERIAPIMLNLKDEDGNSINPHDDKANKIKLIFFWNPDCENCHDKIPELNELYEAYQDKGFEIYAVALTDDTALWKKDFKNNKMNFVQCTDNQGMLSPILEQYYLWSIPSMFIFNENNMIISRPRTKEEIYSILIKAL